MGMGLFLECVEFFRCCLILSTPYFFPTMRIQTPYNFSRFAYFGLDTSARSGDEFLGCGLGRFYFGIYPTQYGFEISYGILNANDCLN